MDVAGVVIGSIALIIAAFGAIGSGYQMQRYWRFRKPLVKIENARLRVLDHNPKLGTLAGHGEIVLNIRGANRPISILDWEVYAEIPDGDAGFGFRQPWPFGDLAPESWRTMKLNVDGAYQVSRDTSPPNNFELDVYLRTPEEPLVRAVPFVLNQKGDSYMLDDIEERQRYEFQTHLRGRHGLLPWLRHKMHRPATPRRGG